ncbi:unnamed protein product [Calypogeia fissa]
MEALRSPRVWTLPSPKVVCDRRNGAYNVNFPSGTGSFIQNVTLCSGGGGCGCVAEKRNYECNECREKMLGVGLARGRLGVAQGSLLHQQYHLQRRRESISCSSNNESRSSATVVSDDDVETHRRELMTRFWDEGFEAAGLRREWDDDGADVDEDIEEDHDEVLGRRGAGAKAALHSVVGSDGEYQAEKQLWWKNLDARRILTPRTKGILLLNILTFLYGSNIAAVKSAGATMDPTLFSVGRFAIASLAFTPFLGNALTDKRLRNASLELGLLASAGYLTQCVSLLTSDAARVSFISTFTVIVVPLLAGLSGAKISKITWIAAATALVGVGILESNGTPFAIGDLWSFVSAVMFGVHILRTEHHSKTLAHEDSLPVMGLQLVVITLCSGFWFCASHFSSGDLMANLPASNLLSLWSEVVSLPWPPMLYTGLLSTAFCLWAELVSMRDVKATEAAVIYTTEPLWGAAFAWLTLGERWGPNGWLGAFFILGGSLTMQVFGQPDAPVLKKIVLPSSDLDLVVDRVDSSDEEEQPLMGTKERDVSIEILHKKKRLARQPVRLSGRNN